MKEQQNRIHKVVSLGGALVAALSLIFLASVAVSGQTISLPSPEDESAGDSVRGITFPIAELGGCANKNECKNYCNQPENMDVCVAFAKDHGLMTEKDATRAEKFGKIVREGSAPGGCNSPQSCDAYCSNLSHLDECTAFAEKNGFKDEHYEQGKKIQKFLKNGGATPGNCQTKEECQTYCGDFSHAKECFNFAQKAGIAQKAGKNPSSRDSHEPNAAQLEKIMELSQSGETPGGCTSKDACEKYCSDASHREECLDFGVKIGFIQPDEAAKIKQMGGKGPGDCDSPESCRTYCNDQSHQEECFKFAEEHGFMTHEESKNAKEGWMRARQGFENAPPEVQECLKTTLGTNIIDDIQSGKLVPGQDIGDQVRGCFEKFGGNAHPQEALKHIPAEAAACLKEKFGDTFEAVSSGKTSMTPEMADSFRVCFQVLHMQDGFNSKGDGQQGEWHNNKPPQGIVAGIENMLRSAPPEIVACVKEKFPEGFSGTETGGDTAMVDIKDKIRGCFENFHPLIQQGAKSMPEPRAGGMNDGSVGQTMENILRSAPPEVATCIKEKFPNGLPSIEGDTQQIGTEVKDKIRGCFESIHSAANQMTGAMMPPKEDGFSGDGGQPAVRPVGLDGQQPPPPAGGGLMNVPPAALSCIRETVGEDRFQKIQTAPLSLEIIGIIRTCLEKIPNPQTQEAPPFPPMPPASTTSQPMTFLEKFIGAALLPVRWILGK